MFESEDQKSRPRAKSASGLRIEGSRTRTLVTPKPFSEFGASGFVLMKRRRFN